MTKRIFRSIVAVSAIILFACLVFIMGIMYEYYGSRVRTELEEKTVYVAQGVAASGMEYLETMPDTDSRITWVAGDGTVLYDNTVNAATMENHADRTEIAEALETGVGETSRYSNTIAQKTHYCAQRLPDGSVIRVSNSQYTVWTMLLSMLQPVMIIIVVVLIIAFLLASRLSKQIVRPINEIDLSHPEKAEGYDEIAPLLTRIHDQNRSIEEHIDELQSRQREFRAITENMSEGLLVIDRLTNVLSYNSAALRLLGASAPAEGESILSLNRSDSFRKAVEQALKGQHDARMMPLGDRRYQLIANPVQHDGSVTGAVLMLMDVTEKELRDELRREFTANVSHELKTPLTSIIGTSEIIRDGMVKSEDCAHFADNIHREATRLFTLVSDIIKLSQLDEDSIELKRENVDLYEIASEVTERLSENAAQADVSLKLEGEKCELYGVAQILDEMVFNLCDNAIKYNRSGGSVTVSVTHLGGCPVLRVSDTGIGIPAGDSQRVFERFYRVDKSRSKKNGGTGLGLSIVKHGALFHGAEIALDSVVDRGTTITITFPNVK